MVNTLIILNIILLSYCIVNISGIIKVSYIYIALSFIHMALIFLLTNMGGF